MVLSFVSGEQRFIYSVPKLMMMKIPAPLWEELPKKAKDQKLENYANAIRANQSPAWDGGKKTIELLKLLEGKEADAAIFEIEENPPVTKKETFELPPPPFAEGDPVALSYDHEWVGKIYRAGPESSIVKKLTGEERAVPNGQIVRIQKIDEPKSKKELKAERDAAKAAAATAKQSAKDEAKKAKLAAATASKEAKAASKAAAKPATNAKADAKPATKQKKVTKLSGRYILTTDKNPRKVGTRANLVFTKLMALFKKKPGGVTAQMAYDECGYTDTDANWDAARGAIKKVPE
jgi:hypothetical protein